MRVSEYFWFDPFNPDDLAGFKLNSGIYQNIPFNEQNQLISQVLNLALVRWQGNYRGVHATWLRWATLEGELFPTSQEMVELERQRANQAESQLKQVAVNLLKNGMSGEQVAQLTGLDILEAQKL